MPDSKWSGHTNQRCNLSEQLWKIPIPILGLTGEHESGKSWFGISICRDPKRVRAYDLEMSLDSYASLGFDHVQVPRFLLTKYPKGYSPLQLWEWWLNDVSNLEAGKFDVILVDPITDLERGLTDWVQNNPTHFGHTSGQYAKMSGIMWGDVKDYWKLILTGRVATKCQTFAFTSHMGEVFNKGDNKPTGERKAKGKETLEEITTLYLQMERKKDKLGNRPTVPSAIVLKSRLSQMKMTETGPQIKPILPPRLPVATPNAVRHYMDTPADYSGLAISERAPDKVMTDDERLMLQVRKAEAERDLKLGQVPESTPSKTESESVPAETTSPHVNNGVETPDLYVSLVGKITACKTLDECRVIAAEMNEKKDYLTQDQVGRLKAILIQQAAPFKALESKSA